MCGENRTAPMSVSLVRGPSPRVRGKRLVALPLVWPVRTIPACAGKTSVNGLVMSSMGDHPRVCGENADWRGRRTFARGPSPRVRGKLTHPQGFSCNGGTIPACAGKTVRLLPRRRRHRDHPRVCGENNMMARSVMAHVGPSPRVRGKRWPVLVC